MALRAYTLIHTFAQMVGALKTELAEYGASDGARSPLLLASHIYNAANQMASETWSMWRSKKRDITIDPNTNEPAYWYESPDILKPFVVTCLYADGTLHYLLPVTPTDMDLIVGIQWRDSSQAQIGNPCYFVYEPLASFQLYPRPNYVTECNTGIMIEGYYVPGEQWNPLLAPDDPAQDDAICPLPRSVHYGVVLLAAINRLDEINNPGADKLMARKMTRYTPLLSMLSRQALNSPAPAEAYDGAAGALAGSGGAAIWAGGTTGGVG